VQVSLATGAGIIDGPMNAEAATATMTDPARRRWLPIGLALAVGAVFSPALAGGFLNYDDPWLIQGNPVFARPLGEALGAIWLDLGRATRLQLGAEYLPLRDTSHLLEIRLLGGARPAFMHAVQLALYVAAVLLFRVALLRSLPQRWVAELAAVHAETVAWLAGRKDVLALPSRPWSRPGRPTRRPRRPPEDGATDGRHERQPRRDRPRRRGCSTNAAAQPRGKRHAGLGYFARRTTRLGPPVPQYRNALSW
jgi:hypothetical protein